MLGVDISQEAPQVSVVAAETTPKRSSCRASMVKQMSVSKMSASKPLSRASVAAPKQTSSKRRSSCVGVRAPAIAEMDGVDDYGSLRHATHMLLCATPPESNLNHPRSHYLPVILLAAFAGRHSQRSTDCHCPRIEPAAVD